MRLALLAPLILTGCSGFVDPFSISGAEQDTAQACRDYEADKPVIVTALDIAAVVPDVGPVAVGIGDVVTNYLDPACQTLAGVDAGWVRSNAADVTRDARTILAKAAALK